MVYATQQDIINRYGGDELIIAADHDGDSAADPAVVEQGLQDATDAINVYIGGRYSLPLADIPQVLKRLCVDMALYLMSKPPAITEEKRTRYEDAIKLLTKISEGKATLGEKDPDGTSASGGAFFSASPRRFFRRRSL